MNNLTVFEQNGQLLTDSREVAMMVGKDHAKLLRNIREYCKHLNESNFGLVDFFIESTYTDSKGEVRPCYLCTKKGCDMIANKMTGKKGVIFTATYIEAFEKMKDFIEKGNAVRRHSVKRTGGITGSGSKHVKNERCKQIADAERLLRFLPYSNRVLTEL